MKLSIVTTMYCSAPYINEFYNRITDSARKITKDYEIIFVNDGSTDSSLELARELLRRDRRIKIIDLSRNFGQHKAIMTGLSFAKGDLIFIIDCDLEESPELLEDFINVYNTADDIDVVYGIQKKRKGKIFQKLPGAVFYRLFNHFSEHKLPMNLTSVRLMSKRFVNNLLRHTETEMILGGLWVITGFKQIPVAIDTHYKGVSAYNFASKFALLINSITSFTSKPLMYIFYSGIFMLIVSLGFVIYFFIMKVIHGIPVPGYTSLIISLWMLGGIIVFSIGIVGIYLSRVFTEVKRRPYTIIKRVYGRGVGRRNEIVKDTI